MATIYHDKDADLKVLKDKTIAIVGWGNQGHAQGENLKDSGLNVIAADLPDVGISFCRGPKLHRRLENGLFVFVRLRHTLVSV